MSAREEARAALAALEAEHPTARIAVGSQTHGGPTQYADGCSRHGAWCHEWTRRQKNIAALRKLLDEPVPSDAPNESGSDLEVSVNAPSPVPSEYDLAWQMRDWETVQRLQDERADAWLFQQGQKAWGEHTVGFTWRDEEQRYGEYRLWLAGFAAGFRRSQPVTDAEVRMATDAYNKEVEAALDALDRQFGTITMTEVGHLVGSTSRFVRAALEAAQAVSGPQERYTCPTPGCGGDGRYPAPGRGHLAECRYPMDLAHESTDGES